MKLHTAVTLVSALGTASAIDLVKARHRNLRLEENLFTDEGASVGFSKKKKVCLSDVSMLDCTKYPCHFNSHSAVLSWMQRAKSGKSQKAEKCAIVPKVESDDPDVWHGDPCFRAVSHALSV